MIRKYLIGVAALIIVSCSSSGEKSNNQSVTLLERQTESFNYEDLKSKVSGKRRGRLSMLKASGDAWFSFSIDSFTKLKLVLSNENGSEELVWSTNQTEGALLLSAIDPSSGKTPIDVIMNANETMVIFNEGAESFVFSASAKGRYESIAVYQDDEAVNPPGILYNISK